MTWSPSSPVTGSAQTDLTSPTYTLSDDVAPDNNGIQHAVTALGGTQTGVTTNTPSSPFTITFVRPKVLKTLSQQAANGDNGSIGKNTYKVIVRKGVTPNADLVPQVAIATVTIDVPAGADSYDEANLQAMLSLLIGALSADSAGVGDTIVSGVM